MCHLNHLLLLGILGYFQFFAIINDHLFMPSLLFLLLLLLCCYCCFLANNYYINNIVTAKAKISFNSPPTCVLSKERTLESVYVFFQTFLLHLHTYICIHKNHNSILWVFSKHKWYSVIISVLVIIFVL